MQVSSNDVPFPASPSLPIQGALTPEAVQNKSISMLDYLSQTGTATIYSQDTLNLISSSTPLLQDAYFLALQEIVEEIIAVAVKSNADTAKWSQIYVEQQVMNQSIDNYNTSVSNAQSDFNNNPNVINYQAAVTAYTNAKAAVANGTMTTAAFNAAGGPQDVFNTASTKYAQAVTTYNDALNSASFLYQGAASQYTQVISSINITTLNQNLTNNDKITQQITTPTATPPAVPTQPSPYNPSATGTSYLSTPTAGALTPIHVATITTQVVQAAIPPISADALQAAAAQILGAFAKSKNTLLTNQDLSINRNARDTATHNITLPDSFITRSPSLFTAGSPTITGATSGAGNSPELTLISAGLSNRNLIRILASALYSSINQQAGQPLSTGDISLLLAFSSGLIAKAAKSTSHPVVDQLPPGATKSDKASTAVDVTGSIAFAENIRSLVASGVADLVVNGVLKNNANVAKLSPEDQQKLKDSLIAAFKIGLLNVALAQVANTAGIPGLSTQILGNVNGAPPLDSALAPSDVTAINGALDNPVLVLFLKEALTQLLTTIPNVQAPQATPTATAAAPTGGQPASPSPPTRGTGNPPPTKSGNRASVTGSPGKPVVAPVPRTGSGSGLPSSGGKLTRSQAEVIINTAVNSILKTPTFNSKQALVTALSSALQNQGINQAAANKLANTTATLLIAEGNFPNLDTQFHQASVAHFSTLLASTPVSPSPLATASPTLPPPAPPPPAQPPPTSVIATTAGEDALVAAAVTPTVSPPPVSPTPVEPAAITPPPPPSPPPIVAANTEVAQAETQTVTNPVAPVPGSLQDILEAQLLVESNANAGVKAALIQTLEINYETNREFRASLVNNLLANGIDATQAAKIANQVAQLTGLQTPPPKVAASSPLTTSSTLPLPSLAEEWSNYLLHLLAPALDNYRSRRILEQSIQTLIGGNSILQQYNEQIRVLRERSQQDAIYNFNHAIPTLAIPSLPAYALRQLVSELVHAEITRYMDPSVDSLMGTTTMPSNFKRNMDVRI